VAGGGARVNPRTASAAARFRADRYRRPPRARGGTSLPLRDGTLNDNRRDARAAWRSNASAIRRSRSVAYGTPLASQSFGYMLIDVKPGIVLISFTRIR